MQRERFCQVFFWDARALAFSEACLVTLPAMFGTVRAAKESGPEPADSTLNPRDSDPLRRDLCISPDPSRQKQLSPECSFSVSGRLTFAGALALYVRAGSRLGVSYLMRAVALPSPPWQNTPPPSTTLGRMSQNSCPQGDSQRTPRRTGILLELMSPSAPG